MRVFYISLLAADGVVWPCVLTTPYIIHVHHAINMHADIIFPQQIITWQGIWSVYVELARACTTIQISPSWEPQFGTNSGPWATASYISTLHSVDITENKNAQHLVKVCSNNSLLQNVRKTGHKIARTQKEDRSQEIISLPHAVAHLEKLITHVMSSPVNLLSWWYELNGEEHVNHPSVNNVGIAGLGRYHDWGYSAPR